MTILLTLVSGAAAEGSNWQAQLLPALEQCRRHPTHESLLKALDLARRADDWGAARELADLAQRMLPDEQRLAGAVARAYWRAGQVEQASAAVARLPSGTNDSTSLTIALESALARGDRVAAAQWAERLYNAVPSCAHDWLILAARHTTHDEMAAAAAAVRRAAGVARADNGYPDGFLVERLQGLPEFLERIGPSPVNEVVSMGAAPLDRLFGSLPLCEGMINGKGPFRLIVDTGGSLDLSLDTQAAARAGVRGLAKANVRGVSGSSVSQQALTEELAVGAIRVRRVLTRIYDMPEVLRPHADGIIGTGMFDDARLQFDFAQHELVVTASAAQDARGVRCDALFVSDAKLLLRVTTEGQPAWALIDTGADIVAIAPSLAARLFPNQPLRPMASAGVGVGDGADAGLMLAPGFDLNVAGWSNSDYSGLALGALDNLLSPALGIQTSLLLGMPVLRQAQSLTIDYPRCAIWIDWGP